MHYEQQDKSVKVSKLYDFSISQTLTCGQCFRFHKLEKEHYKIIAHGKTLYIKEENGAFWFYPTTVEEFEKTWIHYFDLQTDYSEIKAKLSKDNILKQAIIYAPGIRILNQEPLECLISFIFSQNKTIPMIKQVIQNFCEKYGKRIGTDNQGNMQYTFPTLLDLQDITTEGVLLCKAGFRAKYVVDAVNKIKNGDVTFDNYENKSYDSLKQMLMQIKGVGNKVSDCAILFSLGKREAFPIDVWVLRVMRYFYFDNKESSIDEVKELATKKFQQYGGYAQQYLFHYARMNKVAVKNKNKTKGE